MKSSNLEVNQTVDILLATYNGERYLADQLESLLNQTYSNILIYIRDDGSTDNTKNIIREYKMKYEKKIMLVEDGTTGLGPAGNFIALLNHSKNKYTMFCDQDDIWLPHKIETTYNKVKNIEQHKGVDCPVLVHSDLIIVDRSLNVMHQSMSKAQRLNSETNKLSTLLVQNNITGCTVMINEALKQLSLELPKKAIMHDWWIGLIATTVGQVGYVDEGLILYRQHGNNDVGAQVYNNKTIFKRINTQGIKKAQKSINCIIEQANELNQQFSNQISEEHRSVIETLSTINEYSKIQKIGLLLKNNLTKNGLIRNIAFFILV